jgi:hypothetical protein
LDSCSEEEKEEHNAFKKHNTLVLEKIKDWNGSEHPEHEVFEEAFTIPSKPLPSYEFLLSDKIKD